VQLHPKQEQVLELEQELVLVPVQALGPELVLLS
jgi:hypothetical protein